MAEYVEAKVDNEIVKMWRTDGRLYAIAGFLLGLMAFPLLASIEGGRLAAFLQELAPEAVSILVTVFFIDRLNRRRDTKNAEAALKRQLVDDAASISNEIAKNAVHQLQRKKWLRGEDGLLKGADLRHASLQKARLGGANLHSADLRDANLQEVFLRGANLQEADLCIVNLQGADLTEANLREAILKTANLQGADLLNANLQGADLSETNLQDADLRTAQLRGAKLLNANLCGADLVLADLQGARLGWNSPPNRLDAVFRAKFDETTKLPDGSFWTLETDIRRFTDSDHPDFYLVTEERVKEYLDFIYS